MRVRFPLAAPVISTSFSDEGIARNVWCAAQSHGPLLSNLAMHTSSLSNGDGSADCGVSVTARVMLEIFIMSPEIGPMSG
ncbi:hypothetical protein [Yersinia enterocolitica]|uniref:hypothetical protein n=1 Tax=Yersinia enterocolitica TaxID=630 RepID=UPI00118695A0|nr:hypothetical protein [Yersinia enterocolitica]HDL8283182.1 hypothetical protein [Yersinia enterocolitica]